MFREFFIKLVNSQFIRKRRFYLTHPFMLDVGLYKDIIKELPSEIFHHFSLLKQ